MHALSPVDHRQKHQPTKAGDPPMLHKPASETIRENSLREGMRNRRSWADAAWAGAGPDASSE